MVNYASYEYFKDKMKGVDLGEEAVEWRTWQWSCFNVLSRAFAASDQQDSELYMVPGLDLINYDVETGVNATSGYSFDGRYHTIRATREFARGSEVFWSYGTGLSNYHLVLYHGFIVESNVHDYITVWYGSSNCYEDSCCKYSIYSNSINNSLLNSILETRSELFAWKTYICLIYSLFRHKPGLRTLRRQLLSKNPQENIENLIIQYLIQQRVLAYQHVILASNALLKLILNDFLR